MRNVNWGLLGALSFCLAFWGLATLIAYDLFESWR